MGIPSGAGRRVRPCQARLRLASRVLDAGRGNAAGDQGLARADAALLTDYASPMGLLPLRQLLSRRLADHGVQAGASQIMLTDSGTQAIDLLCRFCCSLEIQ